MTGKTEADMRSALLDRDARFASVTLDVERQGFKLVSALSLATPSVEALAPDLVLGWDKTETFAFEPFPCTENDDAPITKSQNIDVDKQAAPKKESGGQKQDGAPKCAFSIRLKDSSAPDYLRKALGSKVMLEGGSLTEGVFQPFTSEDGVSFMRVWVTSSDGDRSVLTWSMVMGKSFQHLAKDFVEFKSMYVDDCKLEGSVFKFMEDWLRKQLQHKGEDLTAQCVETIEEWQSPSGLCAKRQFPQLFFNGQANPHHRLMRECRGKTWTFGAKAKKDSGKWSHELVKFTCTSDRHASSIPCRRGDHALRSAESWSELLRHPDTRYQEYEDCLNRALADAHFKESSFDAQQLEERDRYNEERMEEYNARAPPTVIKPELNQSCQETESNWSVICGGQEMPKAEHAYLRPGGAPQPTSTFPNLPSGVPAATANEDIPEEEVNATESPSNIPVQPPGCMGGMPFQQAALDQPFPNWCWADSAYAYQQQWQHFAGVQATGFGAMHNASNSWPHSAVDESACYAPPSPQQRSGPKAPCPQCWSAKEVAGVLKGRATFQIDECTNTKVFQKGRGVWRVERRLDDIPQAAEWKRQESEMYAHFFEDETGLVLFACHPGRHELVQKMFALGSPEQKNCMAVKFYGHVNRLMQGSSEKVLGATGCHVLQQILHEASLIAKAHQSTQSEPLSKHEETFLVTSLDLFRTEILGERFVDTCTSPHGNHVVQGLIRLLALLLPFPRGSEEVTSKLATDACKLAADLCEEVGKMCTFLGRHRCGCRVIQRLLELPSCSGSLVQVILQKDTFAELVTDEFGNYIIQHILKENCRSMDEKMVVMRRVSENFQNFIGGHPLYATDKYAHHVVVECFSLQRAACPELAALQEAVLQDVLQQDGKPKQAFQSLLRSYSLPAMQKCQAALQSRQNPPSQ